MVSGNRNDRFSLMPEFAAQIPKLYTDLEPQPIYRMHENEKNCQCSSRVLNVEHNIHPLNIPYNWRNGPGMLEVPKSP